MPYTPLVWVAGVTPLSAANLNNLEAAAEKELHIPFLYSAQTPASYPVSNAYIGIGYALDANAEACRATFRVPHNYTTLVGAIVEFVPEGTGTFDYTVATEWGAAGEGKDNDSDSVTEDGVAGTSTKLGELDVSAAFTGIVAGDLVNITFTRDAVATITKVHVSTLAFYYT